MFGQSWPIKAHKASLNQFLKEKLFSSKLQSVSPAIGSSFFKSGIISYSAERPFLMPPKAKAVGKGRAPAKRKLAEEFPPGEILTDTGKKSWKLGVPIGKGGFGLLYLGMNPPASTCFLSGHV